MDLSCAPILTRPEKMVMRSSDRKDIFSERFVNIPSQQVLGPPSSNVGKKPLHQHKSTHSSESHSSFEEGFLMKSKDRHPDDIKNRRKDPEDSSFSLGGSAVWVGDESGLDITSKEKSTDAGSGTLVGSSRPRRSTDASSSSSQAHSKEHSSRHIPPRHPYSDSHYRHGIVKDTHFYHTTAAYKDHHLPVKMPLSTFPEEVGDVGYHSHWNMSEGLMSSTVFSNNPRQSFLPAPNCGWASPPPFTHKWFSNTPYHRVIQCSCYGEAHNFFRPQATSRRSLLVCVSRLCFGLGMWCGPARFHRKSVPVRQFEKQRWMGGCVSTALCVTDVSDICQDQLT